MGLLSWWKGKSPSSSSETKPTKNISINNPETSAEKPEAPGMNGAVEVTRPPPSAVTVFEFGSVAASSDKVTLAGYCPVTDELDPCRWEILPATDSDAPQFRVVF